MGDKKKSCILCGSTERIVNLGHIKVCTTCLRTKCVIKNVENIDKAQRCNSCGYSRCKSCPSVFKFKM